MTYDIAMRNELYEIMIEHRFSVKLVNMICVTLDESNSRIRDADETLDAFVSLGGLK